MSISRFQNCSNSPLLFVNHLTNGHTMAAFADSFNLEITGLLDVRTLNRSQGWSWGSQVQVLELFIMTELEFYSVLSSSMYETWLPDIGVFILLISRLMSEPVHSIFCSRIREELATQSSETSNLTNKLDRVSLSFLCCSIFVSHSAASSAPYFEYVISLRPLALLTFQSYECQFKPDGVKI